MRKNGIVVAIDGPAGAGKSTTARQVAEALDYVYLDTGAMYRAVGLAALRAGIALDDGDAVTKLAQNLQIDLRPSGERLLVLLDGEDVSVAIRSSEASMAASRVAAHQGVRDVLVAMQRAIGRGGGIVLEGRDTGTAIFPDAECKVFLEADVAERARRRLRELATRGEPSDFDTLAAQIRDRDARDRKTQLQRGPWPAPDAVCVDTTGLSVADQVARVVALARRQTARLENDL